MKFVLATSNIPLKYLLSQRVFYVVQCLFAHNGTLSDCNCADGQFKVA